MNVGSFCCQCCRPKKKDQGGEAEDEKEKFKESKKRDMKKTRKISLNPPRKRKRSRPLLLPRFGNSKWNGSSCIHS